MIKQEQYVLDWKVPMLYFVLYKSNRWLGLFYSIQHSKVQEVFVKLEKTTYKKGWLKTQLKVMQKLK